MSRAGFKSRQVPRATPLKKFGDLGFLPLERTHKEIYPKLITTCI